MKSLQEACSLSLVGMAFYASRSGYLYHVRLHDNEEMSKEVGEPVFSGDIWRYSLSMEYGISKTEKYSYGEKEMLLYQLKLWNVDVQQNWMSALNAFL